MRNGDEEMKYYTVRRYTFQELEGDARERAIQEYQEFLYEAMDSDEVKDYLTGRLEEKLGHFPTDLEVRFSLNHCQGDGVAIYGRLTRQEDSSLTWPVGCAYITLNRNSFGYHNTHWNSFSVEGYDGDDEWIDIDGSIIEKQLRDICRELEREGYRYIDSMTGREAAIMNLEEDEEAVFLSSGKFDIPKDAIEKVIA